MRMSAAGLALVKEFEGLRLKAYKCPADVWTIGYGHTSSAGKPVVDSGLVITSEQADDILKRDLTQYEDGVRGLVKVGITQGQFDALVSFAYNAGVGRLSQSTLMKRINAERFDEVPSEFMKWTRGGGKELPGLVRRRRAEVELWRGLNTAAPSTLSQSRLQPDRPKPSKPITRSKEANAAVAAGGLGTIAVAQEIVPLIRDGGELLGSITPTTLMLVVIVLAMAAIWYFRKQRLDEEGA